MYNSRYFQWKNLLICSNIEIDNVKFKKFIRPNKYKKNQTTTWAIKRFNDLIKRFKINLIYINIQKEDQINSQNHIRFSNRLENQWYFITIKIKNFNTKFLKKYIKIYYIIYLLLYLSNILTKQNWNWMKNESFYFINFLKITIEIFSSR